MTGAGTLEPAEPHPAARLALEWLSQQSPEELLEWHEAFATAASRGSRLAEVCSETLRRSIAGESVDDRYLLGLAWTMRSKEWERSQ